MKIAKIVSETNLKKIVEENKISNKLLVVEFFATWCGPCQLYMPIFDQVANKQSEIVMIKADIDELTKETNIEFGISAVPTTVIFKDGKILEQIQGFMSENQLTTKILNHK